MNEVSAGMPTAKRTKRSYDHRIKQEIIRTGNINLFPELDIPKTTAKNWLTRGYPNVVTHDVFDFDKSQLIERIQELESKYEKLQALFDMLLLVARIMGLSLQNNRVPDGDNKKVILRAIQKAASISPLYECLEVLNLSSARYHHWVRRNKTCGLDDQSTCPKSTPLKITPPEISMVKKYVQDPQYSHFSLSSLWLFVRDFKKELHISMASWFRIIHRENLLRPKRKKFYAKPKEGIRTSRPNEILHIDISIFKIREIRIYIQAIRDNFSRKILAHKVSLDYGGLSTKELIKEALSSIDDHEVPILMSDKGCENINENVKELVKNDEVHQLIAQIDISFSNSMIESFFNHLKNKHLYYKDIQSLEQLRNHVDFYVKEQNERIPMMSLNGLTPDQAYETGVIPEQSSLSKQSSTASVIAARAKYYRSLSCSVC